MTLTDKPCHAGRDEVGIIFSFFLLRGDFGFAPIGLVLEMTLAVILFNQIGKL